MPRIDKQAAATVNSTRTPLVLQPPTASEEKDSQRVLSAFDRVCDDLMKSVEVLKSRVEHVMMAPEPPIADTCTPNCNSEYFSRLMSMVTRVRSSVDDIDRIVNRLEV